MQEGQAEGEGAIEWLRQQNLCEAPRLFGLIDVDAQWQRAVEVALGGLLHAGCVPELASPAAAISQLKAVRPQALSATGWDAFAIEVLSRC